MSETAFPPSLQKLVREFSRLPSIGTKSAMRLAYHLIHNDPELVDSLKVALTEAKEKIRQCKDCFFTTEAECCAICSDSKRDGSVVCVVEKPVDVLSIERSRGYRGVYHVLHGLWAPLRGKGPESIKFKELLDRIRAGQVKEVILALSATVEGDATSLYLAKALADLGIQVTRLAHGLPKGGELEFADDVTLSHAFNGRRAVNL